MAIKITNQKKTFNSTGEDMCNSSRFIGQRIARFRKALALTQRDFGQKIGVNHAYLSRIEQGAQRVGMKTLEAICKTFSVDLSHFLVTEDERKVLKKASNSRELEEFVEEFYQLPPNEQKTILEFLHLFIKTKTK